MSGEQLHHSHHSPVNKKFPIVLLLDNFESPLNVGSVFRIADAMAVEKVILTGNTPVPPNRQITKTSRSTEKVVDFEYCSDALSMVNQLQKESYTIVALEITSTSVDLSEVNFAKYEKICLILGAENSGIHSKLLEQCDLHIQIPMHGNNSSMNVAVACGIATFQILAAWK